MLNVKCFVKFGRGMIDATFLWYICLVHSVFVSKIKELDSLSSEIDFFFLVVIVGIKEKSDNCILPMVNALTYIFWQQSSFHSRCGYRSSYSMGQIDECEIHLFTSNSLETKFLRSNEFPRD